ncbi:hypothetical protein GCM10011331_11640 [Flavimobilis marinus]|uniref:histidine kinase n=1 Tax=Flavimobilis marinus TaxID=285351 RepID=A0A1I2HY53_9MICO|nr:HAMP domain-containing sensor histidine kinase [Flavimobilis marinus]GHG49249.1 hypothetical protein GCM10011331_11640 [Flavimobilis marinus]SFF33707.1 His Kinase A (phospho-acceptor) domain-containing protein [Flavimobilis marinus]
MLDSATWWVLAAATVALGASAIAGWARARTLRRRLEASRHEAERLRSLAQARASRSSVLSHEIRTPLALVKGAAELLAEQTPGPLNDRQRQFVDTITQNCQSMIAMAEDLLITARLEAQLFELHVERTDLRALVRQTVREMRRVHPGRILLDSRGAPLWLDIDRNLIRQVIWNLVNNAARHGGEGVVIVVRITEGDHDVLVSVSDDGPGMTPEERENLFVPFGVGARTSGTGLGMVITREIVDLHGGRIFVDTAARVGTVVLLSLPRTVQSAERLA